LGEVEITLELIEKFYSENFGNAINHLIIVGNKFDIYHPSHEENDSQSQYVRSEHEKWDL
jgi:hypothetical protein